MTIEKAKQRTNQLQKDLEVMESFIKRNMIFSEQKEAFENFKREALAIADAEISFSQNMCKLEKYMAKQG